MTTLHSLISEAQEARRRALIEQQEQALARKWVIFRATAQREQQAARELAAIGILAWVPALKYLKARKLPSAGKAEISLKERPVRSGLLLAFLDPSKAFDALECDHVADVVRTAAYGPPYCVPEASVSAFRAMIDKLNESVERSYARRMERKRPKKVILRGLDKTTGDILMDKLFGLDQRQMDEAA